MPPPDSLQTTRLILRRPRGDEAPLIFKDLRTGCGSDTVFDVAAASGRPGCAGGGGTVLERLDIETQFCWPIFLRETDDLAGSIAVRKDENGVNLGYLLARPYWGRGLMAEAVAAVVGWVFGDPSVFRVRAVCDVENEASARVLEKTGFLREGVLKQWSLHPSVSAIPRDCYSYARTRPS